MTESKAKIGGQCKPFQNNQKKKEERKFQAISESYLRG